MRTVRVPVPAIPESVEALGLMRANRVRRMTEFAGDGDPAPVRRCVGAASICSHLRRLGTPNPIYP